MNPKIPKIREEISRNRKKIAVLQAQNRDLEKHLRELENGRTDNPSAAMVYRLSVALDLPMEELMVETVEVE